MTSYPPGMGSRSVRLDGINLRDTFGGVNTPEQEVLTLVRARILLTSGRMDAKRGHVRLGPSS